MRRWGAARGLQPVLFGGVPPESAVVELVEACGGLLNEEGRRRLEKRLRLGLERVERDEADVPSRPPFPGARPRKTRALS